MEEEAGKPAHSSREGRLLDPQKGEGYILASVGTFRLLQSIQALHYSGAGWACSFSVMDG